MSAIPITSQQMTLEEYLEFDYNAEGRYEYFDGEVIEMSGGSLEHSLLGSQINFLLRRELNPKGCLVFQSDVRIKVPAMLPFALVVFRLCAENRFMKIWENRDCSLI